MRKPFNWSLLDRNILYSMLYRARRHIVGKALPTTAIHRILSTHIKAHLPVRVLRKSRTKQLPKLIYVGGTYYSDYDQSGRKQIEIVFSYHPSDYELTITRQGWDKICQLFADTVLHEIVHMRQYRSRGFKTINGYESSAHALAARVDQSYYGHKDEIGAFSFNIACELNARFNGSVDKVVEYLRSEPSRHLTRGTYTAYLDAFNWDHDHQIIKKLKRKILQQLPNAAAGKPFPTSKYLNY